MPQTSRKRPSWPGRPHAVSRQRHSFACGLFRRWPILLPASLLWNSEPADCGNIGTVTRTALRDQSGTGIAPGDLDGSATGVRLSGHPVALGYNDGQAISDAVSSSGQVPVRLSEKIMAALYRRARVRTAASRVSEGRFPALLFFQKRGQNYVELSCRVAAP